MKFLKIKIKHHKGLRSNYFLQRSKNLNGKEMKFLENCKETKIFSKNILKSLLDKLTEEYKLDIEFLQKNKFLLKFFNYAITKNLKLVKQKTHRIYHH